MWNEAVTPPIDDGLITSLASLLPPPDHQWSLEVNPIVEKVNPVAVNDTRLFYWAIGNDGGLKWRPWWYLRGTLTCHFYGNFQWHRVLYQMYELLP